MNHSACNLSPLFFAYRAALPALAAMIFLSMSLTAWAQTASDAVPTPSEGLQEIVVTATKRETNLHDVPFSITALSGEDIVRDRILSLEDVAIHVPGVEIVYNSPNENYLSIRGATTIDDSSGTDQGVSLFIDDIVRTGVADLAPDLFDLDRVEVLKGPQGTLFGRNATGGVISIFTKDPTFKPEILAEATYGNHNLSELKGVLNEPIIDGLLAARIAVTTHWEDGWLRDTVLGRDIGRLNRQSLRGKLLLTPTDDLRGVLEFDYMRSGGESGTLVYGNFVPTLDPVVFTPDTTAQAHIGRERQASWGTTGRIDWTTTLGSLTSISGFRHVTEDNTSSAYSDPFVILDQKDSALDNQFTQELRFASKSSGKFNWLTGLYYLHSSKSRPIDFLFNVIPGSFLASVGLGPHIPSMVRQNTNTSSYGVFAEGTYEVLEKLKLTIGGRYTYETKNGFSLINPAQTLFGPSISANYEGSWSAVTPKATLTYQPFEALLTYATASKGFQGGGFNTQGSTQQALSIPFKAEILWNYEGGVKFESPNHRLQANVSAFLDRYSQLQVISYLPLGVSATTNAGAADIKGIEADLAAAPVHWLTLGLQYNHLHAVFTSYVIDNGPGNPPSNYTGNTVPYAPSDSVTAKGELHFDVPSLQGRIALGADYTYRTRIQIDAANDFPKFLLDKTEWNGMINMHASWAARDDRWSLVLWAKNLRNIDYTPIAYDVTTFYESPAEASNPNNHIFSIRTNTPRTLGITVRARF
jgi:iron complex outermembrane receptor protein